MFFRQGEFSCPPVLPKNPSYCEASAVAGGEDQPLFRGTLSISCLSRFVSHVNVGKVEQFKTEIRPISPPPSTYI